MNKEETNAFQVVHQGYTTREAIDEAKRCLNCKVPLCRKGCPIEHNIPDWIHELSMGNIGSAMSIINNKNPLAELNSLNNDV